MKCNQCGNPMLPGSTTEPLEDSILVKCGQCGTGHRMFPFESISERLEKKVNDAIKATATSVMKSIMKSVREVFCDDDKEKGFVIPSERMDGTFSLQIGNTEVQLNVLGEVVSKREVQKSMTTAEFKRLLLRQDDAAQARLIRLIRACDDGDALLALEEFNEAREALLGARKTANDDTNPRPGSVVMQEMEEAANRAAQASRDLMAHAMRMSQEPEPENLTKSKVTSVARAAVGMARSYSIHMRGPEDMSLLLEEMDRESANIAKQAAIAAAIGDGPEKVYDILTQRWEQRPPYRDASPDVRTEMAVFCASVQIMVEAVGGI